jgi:hypothetical protein
MVAEGIHSENGFSAKKNGDVDFGRQFISPRSLLPRRARPRSSTSPRSPLRRPARPRSSMSPRSPLPRRARPRSSTSPRSPLPRRDRPRPPRRRGRRFRGAWPRPPRRRGRRFRGAWPRSSTSPVAASYFFLVCGFLFFLVCRQNDRRRGTFAAGLFSNKRLAETIFNFRETILISSTKFRGLGV